MKHSFFYEKQKIFFLFFALVLTSLHSFAWDIIVAKDGSGTYTTVQAAINAVTDNKATATTIFVKNGKYREKISIPSTKINIQLIGESVANTIIYYDDPATVLGTQNSASFTINANDFTAMNITFANTYGDGSQAVAVLVNADRAAFKNCRLMGNQDTLYAKGSGTVRHYFYKCYIDGNIDFIFGSSVAVFDSCVIYAKSRATAGSSYMTAANTPNGQTYGYVFRDCFVPANTGGTSYFLGRPWGNGTSGTTSYNKTVYMNTRLPYTVSPLGWSTWDAGTITSQITYAEYKSKNIDGTLADVSSRVSWSKQFADADTAGYNLGNMFSGWDPCTTRTDFCTYDENAIAVSNFRGVKGATSSQFDWNISWPKTGIVYTLYRSNDNIAFSPVYTVTAANDTAVNFKYVDPSLPVAGAKYYFYVQASLTGLASHITDTVVISSKQTINTSSSSISAFAQQLGTPTDPKAYTVSGVNLTGNVTITPPLDFEISNDGGTTWYTNSNPLVLTQSSGVVSSTTILVRLNASVNGDYSGNIVHSSDNADNVNVAVSGTTATTVLIPVALITWPLNALNQNIDSAAARSSNVMANSSRLNNMSLSNGTQVPAVPAYSNLYGQAINSGTTGSGSWGSGNGGNGSSLSRLFYEEFVVKPNGLVNVRVDSFVTNFNFYGAAGSGTNFGYRYACSWSLSGFTADSSDVSSCDSSGVSGAPVTSAHTGGYNNYLYINTKSDGTGPVSRFAFALASGGIKVGNAPIPLGTVTPGVTLTAGDSLTIRLYFSCGSSSAGRYGTLKNVMAKGVVLSTSPVKLVSFSGGYNNSKATVWWNTSNEMNVRNYTVESSVDGNHFSEIGNVASENILSGSHYKYVDTRNLTGVVYYRLRITDISGNISYSNILKLTASGKIFNLDIYPNPADKGMMVNYPQVQDDAIITVKSLDGKKLLSQHLQPGTVTTSLDISGLVKGMYFVTYCSNGEVITKKLIKK